MPWAWNDHGPHRTRDGEAESDGGDSRTESQARVAHEAMMRLVAPVAQLGGSYAASASVRECPMSWVVGSPT
jgi:hypothetical protein